MNLISDQPKRFSPPATFTLVLLAFVIGAGVEFWGCHWQHRAEQKAAGILGEMRWMDAMSEERNQINRYWDSKPEVARALLERDLRAHERLLQTSKQFKLHPVVLTEDVLRQDIGLIHVMLASLCRRINQPDCVSEHLNEAMRLRNASSNEIWAAIARLEERARSQEQAPNK